MGRPALLLLAAPALEAVLAWIFVRRRAYRELPLFFAYLVVSIPIAILRFAISTDYSIYFYVFWTTAAVYEAAILLVLFEAFHWVFLDFYRYWNWFWALFPGAVLIAVGAAAWHALRYPPQGINHLISFILDFSIAVNLIQLAIAVLFFVLVGLLQLDWWVYSFAVVFGFGISAAGALIGYWSFSTFGTGFETVVKYAPPVSYIVAVAFWLTIFIRPEPEFKLPPGVTRRQLLERVRQDAKMIEWLRRKLK